MLAENVDMLDRATVAYLLIGAMALAGAVLTVRHLRWRRAEHRRRYGIGRRVPERRR